MINFQALHALTNSLTSKASQAALNKLGFGLNMLGSSFAPLSYTLIPAECETADAYHEAYRATKAAVRRIISLPPCSREDCSTCTCISGLREDETVACCLKSRPYKEQKDLSISYALGDNSSSVQKFVTEELELDANVCQTHTLASNPHTIIVLCCALWHYVGQVECGGQLWQISLQRSTICSN